MVVPKLLESIQREYEMVGQLGETGPLWGEESLEAALPNYNPAGFEPSTVSSLCCLL